MCSRQVEVKGKVFSKEDGGAIPGASVLEKGTQNGTATDMEGNFILGVTNANATLEISFIGFVPVEYKLKGKDSIVVNLKPDCIRDFLDTQSFTFHILSGLVNTPVGAGIDLALPDLQSKKCELAWDNTKGDEMVMAIHSRFMESEKKSLFRALKSLIDNTLLSNTYDGGFEQWRG
jgi:hypothetical protein